jgi:hypothetical protein
MQQVATASELLDVTVTDWAHSRSAHLDGVPRNASVGELIGEAVRAMELPLEPFYRAVLRGRQLARTEILDDLGIETDAEIEIAPKVQAG